MLGLHALHAHWNKTCAQRFLSDFVSTAFSSKVFVKAVSILLLSFTFSHFHTSSPTLLQDIYFLVFHIPKKLPEMKMQLDLNVNLVAF